jgi:hypothetical protein
VPPDLPEGVRPDVATVRDILRDLGLLGKAFLAWTVLTACLFLRGDSEVLLRHWWSIVAIWGGLGLSWVVGDGVLRGLAKSQRAREVPAAPTIAEEQPSKPGG